MSRFLLFVILCLALAGCNTNKKDTSPFADILSQQPYATLTDSIKSEPKRDDLFFRRAVLLNTNNLPEPALADFQKAWSLRKEEEYALGISTILLDKNPDTAIAFLTQALKEVPNSFLLHLSLARSYASQKKTDEALKICNNILQQNPQQVDVLKMKADLLDAKGNKAEAITTLEKAYRLTPFDVELNYMLALRLAETKNNRVISLCDSLIHADSLNLHADPYYYKGIYYSAVNDKAKALSLFDEAIRHDYNFLDAYIEKGSLLYDQKKFAEALKTFRLANTISNTFPDAYFWTGKCQEAMGQKDEARLNYQRAYELDKTFTAAKEAMEKITN
jgi:tetratricopeptide (TPR) repeat protein